MWGSSSGASSTSTSTSASWWYSTSSASSSSWWDCSSCSTGDSTGGDHGEGSGCSCLGHDGLCYRSWCVSWLNRGCSDDRGGRRCVCVIVIVYINSCCWSQSWSQSMFSWNWFDGIPLVSFVDSNEYPQTIFFDIVDGAVFLDFREVNIVPFCFSSGVFSPDGSSFHYA